MISGQSQLLIMKMIFSYICITFLNHMRNGKI